MSNRHSCFLNSIAMLLFMSFLPLYAIEIEDISFKAKLDGTEQYYVMIKPAGFNPELPVPILIALHGHGSDRFQFTKDQRDECRSARNAARRSGPFTAPPGPALRLAQYRCESDCRAAGLTT
jgi:hypothetical protein